MTSDELSATPDRFRTLALPDAQVKYLQRCPLPKSRRDILETLVRDTPWQTRTITMFGRTCLQPRLIAWYGDAGVRYRYSGTHLTAIPWTMLLTELRRCVEAVCGTRFNSVLVNYYRDHRDSMGLHSDDEPELGPEPVIASLSLGESRPFVMRHRWRKDLPAVRLTLASGSLLLMSGSTQRNWKHGIDKQRRPCGPRINLTFRRIVAGGGGR